MIKVSVVVPVYNAREFLNECLDSICSQDLSDIEVIAVDDGSTDGSGDILDEYSDKYEFFKSLHQENSGVSSARNKALEICSGEYVFFADADDVLEKGALRLLYDRAKDREADIVIAGYSIFNNEMKRAATQINRLLEMDSISPYDSDILKSFALWNKLFSLELIKREKISFPDLVYSEDAVFVMECVYKAGNICGLSEQVYKYRRFDQSGEDIPATGALSSRKIRDFIEAHKIILNLAGDVMTNSNARYFDEFYIKLAKTLIKKFLAHYFEIDDDLKKIIMTELDDSYKHLTDYGKSLLTEAYPLYCEVMDKDINALEGCRFASVVMFADNSVPEYLKKSLESIKNQNIPFFNIFLPIQVKDQASQIFSDDGRVIYLEAETEEELWIQAVKRINTEFVLFASPAIYYSNLFFDLSIKYIKKTCLDFVGYAYHNNVYGFDMEIQPSREAVLAFEEGEDGVRWMQLEKYPYNKLFRLSSVKKWLDFSKENISEALYLGLKKGEFSLYHQGLVFYLKAPENFWDDYLKDRKRFAVGVSSSNEELRKLLHRDEIKTDPVKVGRQIMPLKEKGGFAKRSRKVLDYAAKHVKNRVLFFSIRKDGELEGNAKALYPYIKGSKVICAHRLPHSAWMTFLMKYYTVSSKVIVTDDYEKYLRYYKLRDDQRVVQLWHACGAFKMFGQYGTNISARSERTTHMQYNLVSVSADNLRSIYADAFQIDVEHVQPLGCPRTDTFFDEEYKNNVRNKIYKEYGALHGKEVILYAPTFRDSDDGREYFRPPIDFESLSASLPENQVLVICPHPLMTNEIVPCKCKNILEIRDISTNDMMLVADILITDYSSVIFEFSLTGKPMAFYCYDFESYNRQFYLDYNKDLPGKILKNQQELVEFLNSDDRKVTGPEYKRFTDKYMSACDGHSSERIAQVINGYMEK
ncbi:bifunctional glycosyltransferase/CDP-glycerol:glycerophosphate glycerophosphotransferase [Butyrivibrio sp. MB2005]|uniref:bifunctional glycosyltransferase/CDP-glycerol:glycerophosphate glycerophosphotransferase n=1 Tax=Butyrivibrio sp. MB2005 TaxID=1280678 RepID=UPI0003FCF01B|nr:CDP-glycerol glycerophosphotransferase family protein [Butyrivibrio sp. MB2005]